MGRIIEGFWYCDSCKSKVRGGLHNCPHCGTPRNENTKYERDMSSRILSNEEAEKINRNPDWLCSFCNGLNSDNNQNCVSCGASKTDSEANYFQNREKKEAKEKAVHEQEQEWNNRVNGNTKNSVQLTGLFKKFSPVLFTILGIALVSLMILGLVKLLTPKIQEVTVQGVSWQRDIQIEKEKTFSENDWSLPSGARLLYTKSEVKYIDHVIDHYEPKSETVTKQVIDHYDPVPDGTYTDLGNGYFEENTTDVPVYREEEETTVTQIPIYKDVPVKADKYYYEIDRWVDFRKVTTSGIDQKPIWGEVTLERKEREGNKTEIYTVIVLNEENKEQQMALDYNLWLEIEKGQKLQVKVVLGNITGLADNE